MLFARLRTLGSASWDALATAYEAAIATPWAGQSSEVLRHVVRLGLQRGELEARQTYLKRASAEAIEIALAATRESPASPAPSESVAQARVDAAIAMAVAVAAKPYLLEPTLARLWQPFERQLPLVEATTKPTVLR